VPAVMGCAAHQDKLVPIHATTPVASHRHPARHACRIPSDRARPHRRSVTRRNR
jgi:hypothetical protein